MLAFLGSAITRVAALAAQADTAIRNIPTIAKGTALLRGATLLHPGQVR
ncbi:hypothetical protein [Williamsia phyllosphaerae]|nr:hypothetical protein [Williamsia phyllosphaerae]